MCSIKKFVSFIAISRASKLTEYEKIFLNLLHYQELIVSPLKKKLARSDTFINNFLRLIDKHNKKKNGCRQTDIKRSEVKISSKDIIDSKMFR